MTVNIYIESSIRAPAKKQSGVVGIVLQAGDTDATKTVFGKVEEVTKNHADVICLKNALSYISAHADKILIHTSSLYVNQCLVAMRKNGRFSGTKFKEEWEIILEILNQHEFEAVYNQPNEFKNWLQQECERRAKKHGF